MNHLQIPINSVVDTFTCKIGKNPKIWNFVNIYNYTVIGDNCKVGSYTEISGAKIGNNVNISAKCFIPEGVTIEDNVMIGPGVHFTHEFPPVPKNKWKPILVKKGAFLGSGCIILPGVTVNAGATVGAGAVVTKSVPRGSTWAGVPASATKKPGRKKKNGNK